MQTLFLPSFIQKWFVILLLGLITVAPAQQAKAQNVDLRVAIQDVVKVQTLNQQMDQVLMNMWNGSAGFDQVAIGQLSLPEAIRNAKAGLVGANAAISQFRELAVQAEIRTTGNRRFDRMVATVLPTVREKPDLLTRVEDAVSRQIAAAEAGDLDAVMLISDEMAEIGAITLDNEITSMQLQQAMVPEIHPQHGLTASMIALNQGMKSMLTLSSHKTESAMLAALDAIPGQMRSAAVRMREGISQSRVSAGKLRNLKDPSLLRHMLSRDKPLSKEMRVAIAREYEEALEVEEDLASHLEYGAGLFEKLATGDQSDALMAALVAFDERYVILIEARFAQARDRIGVLQKLGTQ